MFRVFVCVLCFVFVVGLGVVFLFCFALRFQARGTSGEAILGPLGDIWGRLGGHLGATGEHLRDI